MPQDTLRERLLRSNAKSLPRPKEAELRGTGDGGEAVVSQSGPIATLTEETLEIVKTPLLPVIEATPAPIVLEALQAPVVDEGIEQDGVIYAEPILIRPNRSARARITDFVLLKAQGLSNIDIASRMGIKPSTLNTLICRATREGWFKLDDPEERLEHEIKPIVVDNVKEYLTSKDNDAAKLKMTIETAKGIGLFKSHQAVKVEGQSQQMVLALRFETPDSPQVLEGHVLGTPKIPAA